MPKEEILTTFSHFEKKGCASYQSVCKYIYENLNLNCTFKELGTEVGSYYITKLQYLQDV